MFVVKRSSPSICIRPPSALGELDPAVPVVLGERVLDRQDRMPVGKLGDELRQLVRGAAAALRREHVAARAGIVEVRRSDIDRVRDIVARAAGRRARPLYRAARAPRRATQRRPVAAFVRLQHGQTALAEHVGGRLVHLDHHAQRLPIARGADRHDEEVLEVELPSRVQPAADDVDHRQRQQRLTPEVAPERYACERRLGAGAGQRDGKDRVRSEARLVRRAVEVDEQRGRRRADRRSAPVRASAISPFTAATARQDAAAAEARRVAVPELDCLVSPGGSAGRDAGDDDLAVRELRARLRRSGARGSPGSRGRELR